MRLNFPKIPRRIIPLIIAFLVLVLFMPRTAKFAYDYRKGTPWPYETLVAQFDFPILKTEEQIQQEREDMGTGIVPYFKKSQERTNSVIKNIEALDLGRHSSMKSAILLKVKDIYGVGVMSDAKIKLGKGRSEVSKDVIFIQTDKRAQKYPVSEVYKVSSAQNKLLADISQAYPHVNADSLLSKSGIYDFMAPNLEFDKSMTELVHAESADYISPTLGYVNADQKIVSKGEIVTSEVAQMLDSYKEEYNKTYGYDGPRILIWLGNIIIAVALLAILYFCILCSNRRIFDDRNRYHYLITIFLITALAAFIVERLHPSSIFIVPFSLSALYLVAFFKKRVVFPVYAVSLLPLLVYSGNGLELYVMFLTAGAVSIFTFKYFGKGWLQFVNAMIVFAVLVFVYLGFRLIDTGSANILQTILKLLLGSLLSVALYPVIYLFEKLFNLVSSTRLEELADTNNKLLQELSAKAPGTFQHSLQVMHLCSAAAHSIYANEPLIRAGALYHDIGKMTNPLCFIENETSTNGATKFHSGLSPKESARYIIAHVDEGLRLADEYNLPEVIKDFIRTHHGTSPTGYFYTQYLNEGGDPNDAGDFFYHGKKPVTKEQIILMICDSLEAASRSLKDYSAETFDTFVDKIVDSKLALGQLEHADITVSELGIVKNTLKNYLRQMYHGRIKYPERNNNNNNND